MKALSSASLSRIATIYNWAALRASAGVTKKNLNVSPKWQSTISTDLFP